MDRSRLVGALTGWGLLAAMLGGVAALVSVAGTRQLERTTTDFLLAASLVVALQTFVGNSGIVSFGHIGFVGIGAYVTALVTIPQILKADALPELPGLLARAELGLLPTLVLSVLAAALLAALVGGAMARMSELGFAMATLALLVMVHALLANWDSVTRGGYGIYGIPSNTTMWVALGGLLTMALLARLYRASRSGLRLQATREDPLSARSVGVHVERSRFTGWVLSAAMMGAAGSLLAQHLLAFDPDQFFFALTFSSLAMLVIGGRESVTGAIAGAAFVTVVADLLRQLERGFTLGGLEVPELPGLVQLVIAVLIIVVLVFRPSGLLGRNELEDLIPWRRLRASALARGEELVGDRVPDRAGKGSRTEGSEADGSVPALEAQEVVMDFQGLRALRGVSLSVARGEIFGLIGPNGSGKTTLLNVASGVYRPSSGRIVLDGIDITGRPAQGIAELGLARTFQNIRLFGGLTVRENLLAAARRSTSEREVERLIALFDLTEHADHLAGGLAYGEQRRVEAARAVVRRPAVLLLDEPAAGMNEAESEHLLETIRRVHDELGCAVIAIDHDLRLILRLSGRVHVLNQGETIAEGPPEAIARDPDVIEAYLGTAHQD
jgi:branched-chain amino acid transport system permease protein